MKKASRLLLALLLVSLAAFLACKGEKDEEQEQFTFVVYPGARYLPHLTDLIKQADRVIKPNDSEAQRVAIYDTDAAVDDVANFYVKAYGYGSIAPDATNNLSAAKPPAYRRTGDLLADQKAAEPLFPKLNLHPDLSKAAGTYNAVEIAPKMTRPRVTIQRPYFDLTTSQQVNRTLILMSR
ncbi:MAG TPA: hypothetical protein VGJ81_06030 [Thermoanaerobaculia bacterium]|jgi:hypothetical protein